MRTKHNQPGKTGIFLARNQITGKSEKSETKPGNRIPRAVSHSFSDKKTSSPAMFIRERRPLPVCQFAIPRRRADEAGRHWSFRELNLGDQTGSTHAKELDKLLIFARQLHRTSRRSTTRSYVAWSITSPPGSNVETHKFMPNGLLVSFRISTAVLRMSSGQARSHRRNPVRPGWKPKRPARSWILHARKAPE
jgi:hypothetical protein